MSKLMPGESDAAKEAAAAREIPLGRMGRKWDIAMGVLFLASPAAGGSPCALNPCCCRRAVPGIPRRRWP
jgi:NAD(P)-dependent dehydrogenase (short-subunit alcohol dehydrogenase family)